MEVVVRTESGDLLMFDIPDVGGYGKLLELLC